MTCWIDVISFIEIELKLKTFSMGRPIQPTPLYIKSTNKTMLNTYIIQQHMT